MIFILSLYLLNKSMSIRQSQTTFQLFRTQSNIKYEPNCAPNQFILNGKCEDCFEYCQTCSENAAHCTSCSSDFYPYLDGNKCVHSCPDGTYPDSNSICQKCQENCIKCDNSGVCTKCAEGKLLTNDDHLCIEPSECPSKKIYEKECYRSGCQPGAYGQDCQSHCSTIQNCFTCENAQECTSCKPSQFLVNSKCLDKCANGYYTNGDQCTKCSNDCMRCIDSEECVECNTDYVLHNKTCVKINRYDEIKGYQCNFDDKYCYEKCRPGFIYSNDNCDKCASNQLSYKNQCIKNGACPEKSVLVRKVGCVDCPSNCDKCTNAYTCTQCSEGYKLFKGRCFSTCPSVAFSTETECVEQCPDGMQYYSKDNTVYCLSDAPPSTFRSGNWFLPCSDNCEECENSDTCNKCNPDHKVFDGKCVKNCPVGWFANGNLCDDKCPESKPLIYQNQCYEDCPSGTFKEDSMCHSCSDHCAQCKNSEKCDLCGDEYKFYQGVCIENCEGKLIMNNECYDECPENTFKSGNSCVTECSAPSFPFNKECITDCPSGTFKDHSMCQRCSDHCAQCKNFEKCDLCAGEYKLYQGVCIENCEGKLIMNNECYDECPENTFKSGNSCVTECSAPSFPFNKECITDCPSGTFKEDSICHSCSDHCAQCKNFEKCDLCAGEYKLYQGACIENCEGKLIMNNECYDECPENTFKSGNSCVTECSAPSFPFNKECITDCPSGTFKDPQTLQCLTNCPIGTYKDDGKCTACLSPCLECTTSQICTKCQDSYQLTDGKCLQTPTEHPINTTPTESDEDNNNDSTSTNSNNTGLITGVVIASVVALVAIILLIILYIAKRRQDARTIEEEYDQSCEMSVVREYNPTEITIDSADVIEPPNHADVMEDPFMQMIHEQNI